MFFDINSNGIPHSPASGYIPLRAEDKIKLTNYALQAAYILLRNYSIPDAVMIQRSRILRNNFLTDLDLFVKEDADFASLTHPIGRRLLMTAHLLQSTRS